MTMPRSFRRMAMAGIAAGFSLLLSACLISPGKFASTIDLRKDGTFAFGYQGEIHMLGLSKLAEMGSKAKGDAEFVATPCYKDDGDFAERKCTKDEVAQQKTDWEAEQKGAVERDKKNAEMMRAMLGGIDPTVGIRHPEAAWTPVRTPTYSTPPRSCRCGATAGWPWPATAR